MTLSSSADPSANGLTALLKRHLHAFTYAVTVLLPVILRTGKRPVIFSKYSGIGDIVCTFPAALELKKRHPGVEFIYNCNPEFVCLPRLGGVTSLTTSSTHIGVVGYWYRFLLSGFYHFTSDDDRPGHVPTDVYIKDFGRPFGLTLADEHPRLRSDPTASERIKSLLGEKGISGGPLVVIHTGPSWPVREWPHESWAALVQDLSRHGAPHVVRLGTSSHLALGSVVQDEIPGTISLLDQLNLEETVALIEQGNLFIGIDSGLLHIAISVGTPSIGLWGATSPQFRFSPTNRRLFVTSTVECQGCHHRVPRLHWITGCPFDIKCMKEIGVAEVLSKCLAGLESAPRSL